MRKRILLVDDDDELRKVLSAYLTRSGYDALLLPDTRELGTFIGRHVPHLVVLDVMMPGEYGLAACRRLRGRGEHVPIIMLSARDEVVDRVVGLELGADDYVPKPFDPRELVARIEAVLRRRSAVPGAPQSATGAIRSGACELDPITRRLQRDGRDVALTTGEFALLYAFAQHANRPLRRDRLLDLARSDDEDVNDRAIDVQVYRLRRLIEPDPSNPVYIQTVWERATSSCRRARRVRKPGSSYDAAAELAAMADAAGMTRALRSLSEAVRAFGSGQSKPVTPTGPREIRELANGFNAMVEQIEANERERNVMLAGLPHDLRTPISRLRVRTELLDDEEAKAGIRHDVRDIEHIAEQFVQYVRGFEPSTAIREPVDLGALAAERVGRWVSTGNKVRLSGPPAGLVIQGDAVALARLIDNLIGNAVQHGSPPIELEIVRGNHRVCHSSSAITAPGFPTSSSRARSSRSRKCARHAERKAA